MLRDVAAAGLLHCLLFAACSSTTTGTGPSSSSTSSTSSSTGGTTSDPTCLSRCKQHATNCNVDVPALKCDPFCPATAAAIACVEALDCATLKSTSSYRSVCAGGTGTSTSSSGSTTSSSSGDCPPSEGSSGNIGSTCTYPTECTGFGPCPCKDGCYEDQPVTCSQGYCVQDCTQSGTCVGHGGPQ